MSRCAKCDQEVTAGYVLCDRCYKKMDGIREDAIKDILGDDYDLDRLKELVEADRAGRCIVLPCKVGDKVYCIQDYFNDAKMRSEKRVKCRIVDFVQSFPDLFVCQGMIYKLDDVGETVFLTREEAEAAMKRMEGEEK